MKPEENQVENVKEVEVPKKEKEKFLEDLVFKGYTTYGKKIFDGKVEVLFKSLTAKEQLDIEDKIPSMKGSAAKVMHFYSLLLISYSLIKYGDTNLKDKSYEEKLEFVENLPSVVLDKLVFIYNEFIKKVQAVTNGEVIEEVFFETEPTS